MLLHRYETMLMTGDEPEPRERGERSRPATEESYGIPEQREGMLPWSFVEDRMATDRSFWVTTVRPDGRPHVRPTWGVWVDGTFYCGGGERTRWVRNLATNPEIVVRREDAEDVVIVEGVAERVDHETSEPGLLERVEGAYEEKYDVRHGTPFFSVRPEVVFAWSDYPTDATRWRFERSPSGA